MKIASQTPSRLIQQSLFLIVALLLSNGQSISAQPSATPTPSKVMNGYTLAQFGDFATQWNLVTVRYRKDTGEMRWTYANDLAMRTLAKNQTDYPDGAIFAKVGIKTKEDPSFTSSAVPSGARRVQFMVRDKQKHMTTDGWGYALFDPEGKTFPGDEKTATMACAACHHIVPQRGYVFSQLMGRPLQSSSQVASWKEHLSFEDRKVDQLPQAIRAELPAASLKVRVLTGALAKHIFSGSLDEVRPLLSQEAVRSRQATALVSDDQKLFSLVIVDPQQDKCSGDQIGLIGMHTIPESKNGLFRLRYCENSAP